MTGLKQALAPKFGQNRQIDVKTGETRFGPVNSKFPKCFYTTKTISRHLLHALSMSLVIGFIIITVFRMLEGSENIILPVVMLFGIVGGFVGIQSRLRDLTVDDLKILADSRIYLILALFVGGMLAMLLYIIFLSGLLHCDLFPKFMPLKVEETGNAEGFLSIFNQQGEDYSDYAKLMFWGLAAGFSERFVTDVIRKFEGQAVKTFK